ncbi:adenosine deaminase (plasmid) [Cylindrospermum stagnale PCC 7417]|uniref:Adenosine deaminase n=1 Tax=Cylindrospermum stagnale PCC 7417 TaxID=56107 RepID=K9X7E2_9NOST|nr:Ada metal-binding domain-containing protein [Cylindrospermum stagnale]AFZ28540.1 adenosine deaminase [Cylindrospermum stagnale PCC 7417]
MHQERDIYQPMTLREEDCWQAVLSRDTSLNGVFVYAVRSTGVYCRPGCPARQPRRKQVVFFVLPEVAEQAGFRSCQRCCPRDPAPPDPQFDLVLQVCRYIEANVQDPLPLTVLSERTNKSPSYLQRTFKQIMGITPRAFTEAHRLRQLKTLLKQRQSVATALYQAGYGSSSCLYGRAVPYLGMTPLTYQQGGAGMRMDYTTVDCPLGWVLVAATKRSLFPVGVSNVKNELEALLRREYPTASIQQNETKLNQWVREFLSPLGDWQQHPNLPLDIQVIAFQWQVWEELQAFPSTYLHSSYSSQP